LLIVEGDPLRDIAVLRKPAMVIRAGRWWSRNSEPPPPDDATASLG
jgi:hypothetical protein